MAQASLSEYPALKLSRRFAAPPEAVFAALTEVEALKRWFGPEGINTPVVEVDLRPGGAYRIEFHNADGVVAIVGGTFREISPPKRLVYTWIWENSEIDASDVTGAETLVTFELRAVAGGTELTLLHEGIALPEQREKHSMGWSSSLDCLERHLQSE